MQHFEIQFREWKCLNFDYDFTEICFQGSNWQYSSIDLDNGLAPKRRQAIIGTNDDHVQQRIYASFGLNESRKTSKL